ncbi:Alpha crystallin/Hsp20 domain [Macleaya cordata]|uniref:Alpha crystallin/Hsp20 domain n=1 Tax=Macleaya cordata TaxID=56857 RepID=A0A200Q8S1_MACCD|nr:Alpha crystallin/Hsp20 domain [Macleaya cordata]
MDSKASTATTLERSYEDFQPLAHWVREEDNTIEIHLHDFKKEQLRVQFDNAGNMKISGERPLDGNKWRRFFVDFRIPKNIFVQAIQAKFVNGVLYVKLPKSITRTVIKQDQPTPIAQTQEPQTNQNKSDKRDKQDTILGTIDSNTGSEKKTLNQQGDASANAMLRTTENKANGKHFGGATTKMMGSTENAINSSRWSPPESRLLGFGGLEISRLIRPNGEIRMSIVVMIMTVLVALVAYAAYYKL